MFPPLICNVPLIVVSTGNASALIVDVTICSRLEQHDVNAGNPTCGVLTSNRMSCDATVDSTGTVRLAVVTKIRWNDPTLVNCGKNSGPMNGDLLINNAPPTVCNAPMFSTVAGMLNSTA